VCFLGSLNYYHLQLNSSNFWGPFNCRAIHDTTVHKALFNQYLWHLASNSISLSGTFTFTPAQGQPRKALAMLCSDTGKRRVIDVIGTVRKDSSKLASGMP